MPRTCTVCPHPHRDEIDRRLLDGERLDAPTETPTDTTTDTRPPVQSAEHVVVLQ
jgi:hypothetical protein